MADNRPTVSNLDFASVKQDMINYFKDKPEFVDYEFTGSSLNLLMDVLAYNTHYNSLSANFLVNEMFLDSALLRSNVVSKAKLLNYTPRSASSSSATIDVTVTKRNDEKVVIIPGGSLFTASVGNQSTTFYSMEDNVVQFSSTEPNGTQKTSTITIYEGKLVNERFLVEEYEESNKSYELNNINADSSTLVVAVNGVKYEKIEPTSENLFSSSSASPIYFVEESRTGKQKVIFGNGVIGKQLVPGDEVIVSYLAPSGAEGNGISSFTPTIPGRPDAFISRVSGPSQGGGDRETINEIKDYAPKWYQSQYRAVTENDYEAIVRNKFADIQAIKVYGGEEINQPGKVFIAIKPKSGNTLTDSSKYTLKQEIIKESNIVTITPEIVDAEIVELVLKTALIYDSKYLSVQPNILKTKMFALHEYMNTNYVGDFNKPFRESNFSYEIRNLDPSIVSSNTRTEMKFSVSVNSSTYLLEKNQFDLYNRFYHPNDGFKSVLKSTYFNRVGSTYSSGFDDDGYGNIRLFDLIDNKKSYVNNNAGTIDYLNGTIEISSSITIQNSSISFYVVPDSFDIESSYNNILMISSEESVVDVIENGNKEIIKNLNLSRSI